MQTVLAASGDEYTESILGMHPHAENGNEKLSTTRIQNPEF
jgi:hypothetical protein